jgi:hypothetical protein
MPITPAQFDAVRSYSGRSGAARLRVISWYFTAFGALCALTGIVIAVALLVPSLGIVIQPVGHSVAGFCGVTVLAVGFLRTGRLLSLRRRNGAWLAGGCFALNAVGYFMETTGPATFAVALVGLGLVASVWPHLE